MVRVFIVILALSASAPAQAADAIKPGKWQSTSVTNSMNIPGMPPELAAKMQSKPMVVTSCISAEQIKDNPRTLFEASKGACSYSAFSMSGGKLESVALCKQQGGTMKVESSGTYTATSFALKSTLTGGGKAAGMIMKIDASGKWLGGCTK